MKFFHFSSFTIDKWFLSDSSLEQSFIPKLLHLPSSDFLIASSVILLTLISSLTQFTWSNIKFLQKSLSPRNLSICILCRSTRRLFMYSKIELSQQLSQHSSLAFSQNLSMFSIKKTSISLASSSLVSDLEKS